MSSNYNNKQERKLIILGHIVKEYIDTAMPVSSKMVANRMDGSVSSATVRNIMAELEDEGYIRQPHTSAGRIPTDIGYRDYVNILKDRVKIEKREAARLAAEFDSRIRTISDIIKTTSNIISHELHNASIVMWPSIQDLYLKQIQLVKVRAQTVLAVLITMTNAVKNYMIKLDDDLEKADLEKLSNYINLNYRSLSFLDISNKLKEESGEGEDVEMSQKALDIIDNVINENIEDELYCNGLNYFTDEPEFNDLALARRMIEMFADKRYLAGLLRRELPYKGVKVYIGSENDSDVLCDCSVITSGYALNGRTVGRIGVVGPTRIDYEHALTTVGYLSDIISEKLEKINA